MTGKLDGKVALVTGAGSVGPGWGNGKAAAATFAREGAKVIAVDINASAAAETCEIIMAEGGTCTTCQTDVTDGDDVKKMADRAIDEFGRIDILFNNVGTLALGGPVETSEEDWRRVNDVNLTSMFLTCKHVIPHMQAQGGGSIVNNSSIVSFTNIGLHYISYSCSKAAVNQFTRSVAIQHAPDGIRCNAVMPGLMKTPMVEQALGALYDDVEEMYAIRDKLVPLGHMGDAWDVARTALFFASDDSSYVTGQLISVDGGLTLRSLVAS